MPTNYLIAIEEFCSSHHIEVSFINSLKQNGLIEIKTVKDAEYIDAHQLQQLEKIVRLYFELDINLEGIETVFHLLQRISALQDEMKMLRNRLRFYEQEE